MTLNKHQVMRLSFPLLAPLAIFVGSFDVYVYDFNILAIFPLEVTTENASSLEIYSIRNSHRISGITTTVLSLCTSHQYISKRDQIELRFFNFFYMYADTGFGLKLTKARKRAH